MSREALMYEWVKTFVQIVNILLITGHAVNDPPDTYKFAFGGVNMKITYIRMCLSQVCSFYFF